MGGIGETGIHPRRRTSSRSAILTAACCSADHSLNRRNVSPVAALKQRSARVRSMPRYRTSSSCDTRRIGSACIARTISATFAGSGSVANASLSRNSSVAQESPPIDRRASSSEIAFQRDGQRGLERKCQSVEVDDIGTSATEPNAVHDPRPDEQDVTRDAHACMLDRDRPVPPRQHGHDNIRMRPETRDRDGQYRAGERRFPNSMVPTIGNSVVWRKSSSRTIWPASDASSAC
jgi:hypothetical protein